MFHLTESKLRYASGISEAIAEFDILNEKIREFLYQKLYRLYNDGKLNNGRIPPHRSARESVLIKEFNAQDGKISVEIAIWWGGDVSDDDYLDLTYEEWDAIQCQTTIEGRYRQLLEKCETRERIIETLQRCTTEEGIDAMNDAELVELWYQRWKFG